MILRHLTCSDTQAPEYVPHLWLRGSPSLYTTLRLNRTLWYYLDQLDGIWSSVMIWAALWPFSRVLQLPLYSKVHCSFMTVWYRLSRCFSSSLVRKRQKNGRMLEMYVTVAVISRVLQHSEPALIWQELSEKVPGNGEGMTVIFIALMASYWHFITF